MLSTLLLYPTCPDCGGNLPFVSRHYSLYERAKSREFLRRRRASTEITAIECPGCGAGFYVQERGLALILMVFAAVCVVGYLGWGGQAERGVGFTWFFAGSAVALLGAWLVSHRMTVLTPCPRAGESVADDAQVADVFTQLEARDARIEVQQAEQSDTLVQAEAAWAAEEARTVPCPRCGTNNAPDFEKCWSCEAVLTPRS